MKTASRSRASTIRSRTNRKENASRPNNIALVMMSFVVKFTEPTPRLRKALSRTNVSDNDYTPNLARSQEIFSHEKVNTAPKIVNKAQKFERK